MRFSTKEAEATLSIYKMAYFGGALYIEHKGTMESFSAPPTTTEGKDLLRRVIKAFLQTNPEGFQRITSAMLSDMTRYGKLKALLEHMESVSLQLTYSLTEQGFWEPFFSNFKTVRRFPTLTNLGAFTKNIPEYLSSYSSSFYYWTIETTENGLLVISRTHAKDTESTPPTVYTCQPIDDENFLTPSIFKEAMKDFLALDRNAFYQAFGILKDAYLNTEPAWTPWFFQMSLMVDVYHLQESKMLQASRFCPWIDYD